MRKIKYTKVFFNGVPLRDIAVGTTWFERLLYRLTIKLRQLAILTLVVGSLYGALEFSGLVDSNAIAYTAPIQIIKEIEPTYPVLDRIAKCESGGTHTRNGQVIFNGNTNKSVDIGLYQINSIWSKKATEMGLDLTKEVDNKKFALYLYKTHGTEPWYSSKACWNK